MNPIEAATMDELLEELRRRCKAVIVAWEMPVKGDDDEDDTQLSYAGGLNAAIGLARRAWQSFERDGRLVPKDDGDE